MAIHCCQHFATYMLLLKGELPSLSINRDYCKTVDHQPVAIGGRGT